MENDRVRVCRVVLSSKHCITKVLLLKDEDAFHYVSTLGKSALGKSMGPNATSSAGRGSQSSAEKLTGAPTTFGMLGTPAFSAIKSDFVVSLFSCPCGSVFVFAALCEFSLM